MERNYVTVTLCIPIDRRNRQKEGRIKADAIDAEALDSFEKQAHGHGRLNEKSLLYFGCDFSGRYNFETKSLKLLPLGVTF